MQYARRFGTDTNRSANSSLASRDNQTMTAPFSGKLGHKSEVYLFEGKEGAGTQEQRRLARVFTGVHEVLGPLDLGSGDVLQQSHVQVAGNVAGCGNLVRPCTPTQLPAGLLGLTGSCI